MNPLEDFNVTEFSNAISRVVNGYRNIYKFNHDGNDFYQKIRKLCLLFYYSNVTDLDRCWDEMVNYDMTEEERVDNICTHIYDYLGVDDETDLRSAYMDDCIFKIYQTFPNMFPDKQITTREEYIKKEYKKSYKDVSMEGYPDVYVTSTVRDIPNSYFDIMNKFRTTKKGEIYCTSQITFYYRLYTQVIMSVRVIVTYRLGRISNRKINKAEKDICKWMLRKIAFVKFLEIIDDLSFLPNNELNDSRIDFSDYQYLKEPWYVIYMNDRRNKIRLG